MRALVVLIFTLVSIHCFAVQEISIQADDDVLNNSITAQTISDCRALLKQVFGCEVTLNNPKAEVVLRLPLITIESQDSPNSFSKNFDYPYYQYPEHGYHWVASNITGQQVLMLNASSYEGISFGLYGLLQEQLGVLFVHPKQTIIPKYNEWPASATNFDWSAQPQFDKKGFHLHTQHPLELTEQLLDETFPNALEDVKEYIDWLVRNGQNYFEFNLLEGINRDDWPAHAKAFVDYGKSRGVIMGVDISLHMIQQKAYMLYQNPPANFKKKTVQIEKNLAWLFQADWDVINMEFSTTEFSEGDIEEKEKLRLMIIDLVENTYGAKLMGRAHVVKKDEMTIASKDNGYEMTEAEKELDSHRGVLIHTVMFYTATEENAPVYQNDNLQHMMTMLEDEIQHRETWYYPESAYWITFDVSIPMLLLPYLNARLDDINTMVDHKVPGHVTFSSGWEWGYWLIDYSIARWSWAHTYEDVNKNKAHYPTEYIEDIFENDQITSLFNAQLNLQQEYLKDKNLMQYMSPANVTDELPGGLNLQFEPRPEWKYRFIRKKADMDVINQIKSDGVSLLNVFGNHTLRNIKDRQPAIDIYMQTASPLHKQLLTELLNATTITGYRALHKANTLSYLLSLREAEINGTDKKGRVDLLDKAVGIRNLVQGIVTNAEQNLYRYPVELIARKHWSHTYCHFGYLYMASNLHFWEREELQIKKDRYGPFYKLIWNLPRTIGLVN